MTKAGRFNATAIQEYRMAARQRYADEVRVRRTALGYTQQNIADFLGCARLRIIQIEKGEGGGYERGELDSLHLLLGYPDDVSVTTNQQLVELYRAYTDAHSRCAFLGDPIVCDQFASSSFVERVHTTFKYSPDGKYLLVETVGGISIVNTSTGKVEATLKKEDVSCSFSSDAQKVVFTDDTGNGVHIWNWEMDIVIPHRLTAKQYKENKEYLLGPAHILWATECVFVFFEETAILQRWDTKKWSCEIFYLYQLLSSTEDDSEDNATETTGEYSLAKNGILVISPDHLVFLGFSSKVATTVILQKMTAYTVVGCSQEIAALALGSDQESNRKFVFAATDDDDHPEVFLDCTTTDDGISNRLNYIIKSPLSAEHPSWMSRYFVQCRSLVFQPDTLLAIGLISYRERRHPREVTAWVVRNFSTGQVVVVATGKVGSAELSPLADSVTYVDSEGVLYIQHLDLSAPTRQRPEFNQIKRIYDQRNIFDRKQAE